MYESGLWIFGRRQPNNSSAKQSYEKGGELIGKYLK